MHMRLTRVPPAQSMDGTLTAFERPAPVEFALVTCLTRIWRPNITKSSTVTEIWQVNDGCRAFVEAHTCNYTNVLCARVTSIA